MKKNPAGFTLILLLIAVVSLSIVIVSSWHIFKTTQAHANDSYFAKLSQTMDSFYYEQSQVLGFPITSHDLVKECYITHNIGSSQLWCDITVDKKVQVAPVNHYQETQATLNKIMALIKRQGFRIYHGSEVFVPGATFSVDANQGPISPKTYPCSVSLQYDPNSNKYDSPDTILKYNLNCTNKAFHIPAGFSYNAKR